jgi:hypothetical protein
MPEAYITSPIFTVQNLAITALALLGMQLRALDFGFY